MDKRKLAQKRNWFKYVITGLSKPIDKSCLSLLEIEEWDKIIKSRETILKSFNNTSKQAGLNVIKACWCGSRRKTNCGDEFCKK